MEDKSKQDAVNPDIGRADMTKPGERVFTLLLFVLGVYITIESRKMYLESPTLSGYGTVPLICGVLLTLLSAYALVRAVMTESVLKGRPPAAQAKAVGRHLFSRDVMITLLMIAVYCVSMGFGAPFIIVTPIFLWISMSYLRRGDYLKNILYTAIVFAFVYLVFHVGFSVVLP